MACSIHTSFLLSILALLCTTLARPQGYKGAEIDRLPVYETVDENANFIYPP